MSLPTLMKTWQFAVNQAVPAQGTSVLTETRLLWTIKQVLKSFPLSPWVCKGSSNATNLPSGSAGMDGVDRWASSADIVGGSPRFPWIVLEQSGIAPGFQICLSKAAASVNTIGLVVSPNAGFTGGSVTARPTAVDEITLINTTTWESGADAQHQVHVWQSTDGQCTRVMVWRGGTNLCTCWVFDRPQNPVSGWTHPSVSMAVGAVNGEAIHYNGLNVGTNSRSRGVSAFDARWTGEGFGSAVLANVTDVGTQANDFDGAWPFLPIGVASTTLNNRGRHGSFFDLWWKPVSVNSADTFPNDAATRRFVAMGPLILPWTGDATIPLLT